MFLMVRPVRLPLLPPQISTPNSTAAPATMEVEARLLTDRERRILTAFATAAIPPGRHIPGGGAATAVKAERYLSHEEQGVVVAYRALLVTLEGAAVVHHGRPFSSLEPAVAAGFLEEWRNANYASRMALKMLTAVIKVLHFEDDAVYARLGCAHAKTPTPEARPRWITERTVAAEDVAGETLECDVVVIGTGAGGAVVAKELAERGVAVVMLEEGRYHDRSEFNGRTSEMHKMLYRPVAATMALGNAGIYIPVGRSVGGTTTVNSGTCYRAPERIFREWREHMGLGEFTSDSMAPYYERVEQIIGVEHAAAAH